MGKLADYFGGHLVLSPEGGVLATSPETESSYAPLQSLNKLVTSIKVVVLDALLLSFVLAAHTSRATARVPRCR